jgi:hypothetical protein
MRLKIVFLDLLIKHISSLTSSRGQNIEFINQAYRKPLQFISRLNHWLQVSFKVKFLIIVFGMKFIKITHTEIPKKIVTLEGTFSLIKNDKTRVLVAKVYGMYMFCLLHKYKQFANHILYPRKTR